MNESIEADLKQTEPRISHEPEEVTDISLAINEASFPEQRRARWWEHVRIDKIVMFGVSLYLFVMAITLMKAGASGIAPLLSDLFEVSSGANSLGFGWLFAYLIMSGSPVAAAALTFFDAGILDEISTFAMITGSRLGASFIVILIGFIYIVRGRDRETSLSMGTLAFTVTASTYLPGLFLGIFFLKSGFLDSFQLSSGVLLTSVFDVMIEPIADLVAGVFPPWLVFISGIVIISFSFNLFDRCLPQMTLKESHLGWVSRLVYRPVIMFALGAFVTLISMSVSISLSLLVPLSYRGFIRRENVIPYIMGANITTFVDTLLASMLLENQTAFTIVLVEMLCISIISLIILILFYSNYRKITLNFFNWVTDSTRNLVIFLITILIIPLVLLLV
ncbi:MAG: hypothetical protein ACK2UE_19080 [Anaerolineales bacterium]